MEIHKKSRDSHTGIFRQDFDRVYFYLRQSLVDHVTLACVLWGRLYTGYVTPAVTFLLKIENTV